MLTVAEVAAAAYFNANARGVDPLLSATRFYDPLPAYANGCFVATPVLARRGTIGGVKGMGESGMVAAPAAVINAVADALAPFGGTLTHLPLTPERVWRLAAIDIAN